MKQSPWHSCARYSSFLPDYADEEWFCTDKKGPTALAARTLSARPLYTWGRGNAKGSLRRSLSANVRLGGHVRPRKRHHSMQSAIAGKSSAYRRRAKIPQNQVNMFIINSLHKTQPKPLPTMPPPSPQSCGKSQGKWPSVRVITPCPSHFPLSDSVCLTYEQSAVPFRRSQLRSEMGSVRDQMQPRAWYVTEFGATWRKTINAFHRCARNVPLLRIQPFVFRIRPSR